MTIPRLLAYATLTTAALTPTYCHHGQAAAQTETIRKPAAI